MSVLGAVACDGASQVHGSRGRVGPGEVLAVMGPSGAPSPRFGRHAELGEAGAGKTSLFNALSCRGTGQLAWVAAAVLLNRCGMQATRWKARASSTSDPTPRRIWARWRALCSRCVSTGVGVVHCSA